MNTSESILILDAEAGLCSSQRAALREKDYEAEPATTGREALEKARKKVFDLALIENQLPDTRGTLLIEELKRLCPETAAIIITGSGSFDTALEALEKGAGAQRMELCAEAGAGEIRVAVTDDGAGFDTSNIGFRMHEDGGFGLFNVRETIDCLGGRLELWSQPGKGTRAAVAAPSPGTPRAERKGS